MSLAARLAMIARLASSWRRFHQSCISELRMPDMLRTAQHVAQEASIKACFVRPQVFSISNEAARKQTGFASFFPLVLLSHSFRQVVNQSFVSALNSSYHSLSQFA
ncbi:hypothetical protein PMIN03_011906 [Paraphaeosphaeria minitans]